MCDVCVVCVCVLVFDFSFQILADARSEPLQKQTALVDERHSLPCTRKPAGKVLCRPVWKADRQQPILLDGRSAARQNLADADPADSRNIWHFSSSALRRRRRLTWTPRRPQPAALRVGLITLEREICAGVTVQLRDVDGYSQADKPHPRGEICVRTATMIASVCVSMARHTHFRISPSLFV